MKSFFADEAVKPETLATWAAKNLSARIDVSTTAKLLGFAEHDIQILMASGKLIPLGDPAPNAPKYFSGVEMIQLASDRDWLHKATKELAKHWKIKRERNQPRRFGLKVKPFLS
jgi:hypothetical protein